MKKKLIIIISLIVLILLGSVGFIMLKKITTPKKVHLHAGFIIFSNNKKVDLSAVQYMNIKPCKLHEDDDKDNDIQLEKAHLHDNVGDVVHVEREGGTWQDLFTNIHYSINYKDSVAYLNGNKVDNFQKMKIQPYDSLVIFTGEKNDFSKHLSEGVKKEYIQTKEKKSEDCGS